MQPAAMSDSPYYIRLGLDCDPFADGALPGFFFVGAQRRFLVQRAVHALYFSGAVVLLLGAAGAGKTHTLAEIEKELQDLADICHIEATVLMDATEIRALLAAALSLPGAVAMGNAELVHALERVRPADGDPQPVLVAIDAAHLLSIETLAECAALIAGAGGRLRLLLAGEMDLATAWQQSHAGVAELLELKPLGRRETEDYVVTRLQAAGYRDLHPLSAADFEKLFVQSGGNFAAINHLLPQFLQPAALETVPVVQRLKAAQRIGMLPVLHIGIAAALLAVLIVLMLYRGTDSPSPREAQSLPIGDGAPQRASAVTKNVEQKTIALQLPVAAPVPTTSPALTPSEGKESRKELLASKSTAEQKAAADSRETVTKKDAPETMVAAQKIAKSAEAPAANTAASALSTDERALLAMPSSNYVLQLAGAGSKETLDKFILESGKDLPLYCYRTRLQDKPWFIVVTGPYADRAAAQAAEPHLPEAVRRQKPWARALDKVQADIRAQNGH